MNIILYTAGSHGRFLKFLFDCYTDGKILQTQFNANGNSHSHIKTADSTKENTIAFDTCNEAQFLAWQKLLTQGNNIYGILWQGLEEFYYILQAYNSRGGLLTQDGISLIENNLIEYEKVYGSTVYITKTLKKYFNFDSEKLGQPPRGLLRNYFLFCFFTYFEHICWIKNKELSNLSHQNYTTINVKQLLDYTALEQFFYKIFNKKLNFQSVHEEFLDKNIPLKQLNKVKQILDAINKGDSMEIAGLNIISEAYILFFLECKYFDIPFNLGNNFFTNTKEIKEYIDHFPAYLKKPNNIFQKYFKFYQR